MPSFSELLTQWTERQRGRRECRKNGTKRRATKLSLWRCWRGISPLSSPKQLHEFPGDRCRESGRNGSGIFGDLCNFRRHGPRSNTCLAWPLADRGLTAPACSWLEPCAAMLSYFEGFELISMYIWEWILARFGTTTFGIACHSYRPSCRRLYRIFSHILNFNYLYNLRHHNLN